jgi:DNA excision repair protein ERCC-2
LYLREETQLFFPYEKVRPHQDEYIKSIKEAVGQKRSVLIEGSNGLGKTIAALSACLPTAIEQDLRILYVARTHRQHERVIEELKEIGKKRHITGISIRSRHEMCLNHLVNNFDLDAISAMEICELLKVRHRCPYYENIQEKPHQFAVARQSVISNPQEASEINRISRKTGFCPYELAKSLLPEISVVALSYLYVFDPLIRNAFLRTIDTTLDKIILIVDEAHNLPETAVDIASSSLSVFTLKQAEIEANKFKLTDVANFVCSLRIEIEKASERIAKEESVTAESFMNMIREKTAVENPKSFFEHMYGKGLAVKRSMLMEGKNPKSYIHGTADFLLKWLETAEEESFIRILNKYVSRRGIQTSKLEIVALDPSRITEPVFSSTYCNVVTSGTLQPLGAHKRITKLPWDTIESAVPSPFPKEHILPLICTDVTTAMSERKPTMYRKIIERIVEIAQYTPANAGVFTPSFEVLEALRGQGLEQRLDRELFCEFRGMKSKENQKMVSEFKARSREKGAVLLGVMGGRSSEGVDFPGDQMNSVAIVGIPYAEPTVRVKAQIRYFEKCFPTQGREYAYVIPAMKKACQAAGRPIRGLEDRGAMVFLDDRFSSQYCQSFLPSWIRNNLKTLPEVDGAIGSELRHFFEGRS